MRTLLAQIINASIMCLQGLACALHLHLRALVITKGFGSVVTTICNVNIWKV